MTDGKGSGYPYILGRYTDLSVHHGQHKFSAKFVYYSCIEINRLIDRCRSGESRRRSAKWRKLRRDLRELRNYFRLNQREVFAVGTEND